MVTVIYSRFTPAAGPLPSRKVWHLNVLPVVTWWRNVVEGIPVKTIASIFTDPITYFTHDNFARYRQFSAQILFLSFFVPRLPLILVSLISLRSKYWYHRSELGMHTYSLCAEEHWSYSILSRTCTSVPHSFSCTLPSLRRITSHLVFFCAQANMTSQCVKTSRSRYIKEV